MREAVATLLIFTLCVGLNGVANSCRIRAVEKETRQNWRRIVAMEDEIRLLKAGK